MLMLSKLYLAISDAHAHAIEQVKLDSDAILCIDSRFIVLSLKFDQSETTRVTRHLRNDRIPHALLVQLPYEESKLIFFDGSRSKYFPLMEGVIALPFAPPDASIEAAIESLEELRRERNRFIRVLLKRNRAKNATPETAHSSVINRSDSISELQNAAALLQAKRVHDSAR